MQGTQVAMLGRRTLCAVYRFYDAFMLPLDDRTPPLSTPLQVDIPSLGWTALRVEDDQTYRFSASTLRQPAPTGVNLAVRVHAPRGDYASFDPILLSLPLPLSAPPLRSDVLIPLPLWPTPALRPPPNETSVRGQVRSATAQPVGGLRVEMWAGAAAVPPPGTPFTQTDASGGFLVRFPLLKSPSGQALPMRIRLNNGLVPVSPASLSLQTGQPQTLLFLRN